MKLYAALLGLIPATLANFHINNMHSTIAISGSGQDSWDTLVVCPSNYYKCACLANDDRTGHVTGGEPGDDYFAIQAGFCGMPQMNFYKNGDVYKGFIDGGDGAQIATCYWNDGESKSCTITMGSSFTNGGWVCYSYACGE